MTQNPLLVLGGWYLANSESRMVRPAILLVNQLSSWSRCCRIIIYTEDGYLSAAMIAANRLKFGAGDIAGGTDGEKVAATDSFMGLVIFPLYGQHPILH